MLQQQQQQREREKELETCIVLGSIFEGQEFAWVGRALQINADWRMVAQVYGAERTPRHLFPFVSQHQVTAETLIERTWETTIAKETTGVSGGSVRFNHPLVLDSLSVHLRVLFLRRRSRCM